MKKLESEIETPFANWINSELPQWWALKFCPLGRRGWPDRIILGPKRTIFFIEFKRPGEELEPLQKFTKKLLENLGFKVYVSESTEDAKKIVRSYF